MNGLLIKFLKSIGFYEHRDWEEKWFDMREDLSFPDYERALKGSFGREVIRNHEDSSEDPIYYRGKFYTKLIHPVTKLKL